ncbi:MAG: chemotaxis protein CheA, partial [Vulcanimicrobiota bacterium]
SYIQWDIILAGQVSREDIEDVFIFVDDSAKITIEVIDEDSDILSEEEYKPLGKILSERGDISEEDIDNALREQKPVGEILINKGVVSKEKITSALEEQKTIRELRARRNQEETTSNIRVSSDKLDKLINLVGEIVIAQARLSQYAANKNQPELEYIAEEVERLTIELRDSTLNIRMVPIETSFSKFKRLVRDLSRDLNKEINLYTFGGDTELDKNVIEKLNDPLVHLIRNSIDHGLETPEERVAKGKPRAGCIELSAFQSGADVMIEIRDDGQGLDEKAIFNKAVQKQLISPDAELSRKEIFSLILQPGFSTSSKVTNISGRGVGMDVVKKCIDQLKGNIIIESEKGRGTIITLKLPLTLAIIEGLLVKINDSFYVIPLYSVEECVELTKRDIKNSNGRHLIEVREELVPYVRLREYFDFSKERPPIEQIVITNHNNHRIGLVVDEVVGEHQTVVKTLGTVYKNINSISGATILGDGTVALILDIVNLIREAEYEELDWIKNTFNGVK